MMNCPKCNAVLAEGAAFCESCGAQIVEGTERKSAEPPRSRLGSLAEAQHKKHIKNGRTAIMAVAILILLSGIGFYFLQNGEIAREVRRVEALPNMVVDQAVVAKLRTQIKALLVVNIALAAAYLGLFFWARTNPFGAALTALILFVTLILVGAAVNPATIVQGWLVKIIVIGALASAVKSGLAHRKLQGAS